MLKHPALTRDRVRQFLARELRDRIITETLPLSCELNIQDFASEAEAKAAKGWEKIEKGHTWGPAYQVGWYRVTGKIPAEWAGRCVALGYADAGLHWEKWGMVEGTLWQNGETVGGLDFGHQYHRITEKAAGGEAVEFYVQTFAHNVETTVHMPEKPRTAKPEEYKGFLLYAVDQDILDLFFDVDFALSLVDGLQETNPLYHNVLRLLNDTVNTVQGGGKKSIAAGRKLLRDGLSSFSSDQTHEMVAVGHAHLDTAWLWPLRVTELKMIHTTSVQLGLIERYPDHVFVHSQASQYEWLRQQQPGLLDRIRKAVKKGQWEAVGSMWVEADCNLTGSEALVRQFLYGRRWFKQHLGVVTEDMWLPDVFGYSAAIPQILSKFGIKYFLTQKLSWNDTNKPPHHTFWWEGIDGSRVWVHFPPADTYNASCEPKELLQSVKNYKDHGRMDASILLYGFGDGGGGPTELHIERIRRARSHPAGLPTVHKRKKAIDFFKDGYAASRDLCTWRGELYFEKHRGTYTTQANNKKFNRMSEFLLRDAELLASFDGDLDQYPKDHLESLWKLTLLQQFHDIIPGSSVREVYEDSDRDYAKILSEGSELVGKALAGIGSRLDTGDHEKPIALFHNSTMPSQGSVEWAGGEVPNSLVVGSERKAVQLVTDFDGKEHLIFETPESALGAVSVGGFSEKAPHVHSRPKASGRKLENEQWAIKFDSNGHIVSIQSQDDEPAEYIVPGGLGNLFQLFEDTPLFWDAWDVDAFSLEKPFDIVKCDSFEVVEKGPVRAAVELVKTFGNSRIRQRISVGPTPGIRFDTEIDWHEAHRMLKVAFPVNVHAQRATYEIQWGHVERPTHQNTSWDVARFEVCCQKWFDLSEGGQGLAILNDSKYGCDVVGSTMRQTLLRSPKAPDPKADIGRHRFTYVLYPHFDQIQHSYTVAAAYALNAPVRTAWLEGRGGEAAQGVYGTPVLASVDSRSVIVETVKKAEDSRRLVARVYECHNTRGRSELKLALPVKKAWLADMNEEPMQELEVEDGRVRFSYKPFEIITILAEV